MKNNHSCNHQTTSDSTCHPRKLDWLFHTSLSLVIIGYLIAFFNFQVQSIEITHIAHHIFTLINIMWWGIALGIFFVGLLSYIPRDYIMSLLGKGGNISGLFRATLAGTLFDLCSHGILLVGMKLYERGASIGQVIAFLLASPWNSFSLTIILVALIGLPWTLVFIGLSIVIAIITGWCFDYLVTIGKLPSNPNQINSIHNVSLLRQTKNQFNRIYFCPRTLLNMLWGGWKESQMVMKWLFIGVILASILRTFINPEHFQTLFGPTIGGLALTIFIATIVEICSEGSTPIAADILTRAEAPGNSFAFLMSGVSTDYTEIMSIKETTQSLKIALFLPLISLPQIIFIAWLIN